ncbi:MAG: hypothetical protein ACP5GJ_02910 [Nanopusillaceae archaeon]
MIIIPIAFDSFSTRSMATIVKTDINIFIDPSIAIGPRRYGFKPHPIELEEMDKKKDEIIELSKDIDLIIITHYHWDHCPRPEEKHFKILYNKKIILKNINDKINNSQKNRGKRVIGNLKNNNEIIFGDNKKFEINNTYIEISPSLFHGEENSPLGFLIAPYIEYKNKSLFFGSDIQGILNDQTLNYIIEKNPDYIILSGPPFYHPKWDNNLNDIFYSNIVKLLENTKVDKIIIDHHMARSKDYFKILENLNEIGENYGAKFLSAADYLNIENKLLEANRDILYQQNSAAGGI